MTFYTGDAFPQWRGNLFVGAMTPRYLGRLIVENCRVVREERLLGEKRWRVRVVQQGPDGFLYLGIEERRDGNGGMIVRLRPADR
jgi:glucose/arabinose dehydrogenase